MKTRFQPILSLIAVAAVVLPGAAMANKWQRTHPGRVEINHRIANQNRRITQERREGDLTAAQAHALRADDKAIRAQERADVAANHNHGHLTGQQVRNLNQNLNSNSQAIGH